MNTKRSHQRLWLVPAIIGLAFPSVSRAHLITFDGFDLFTTGSAFIELGSGLVPFESVPFGPLGNADTIVQRITPAVGATDTIDIEIIALQLRSVSPIDLGFGPNTYFATLGGSASTGMMTINNNQVGAHGTGGTFSSVFTVNFDLHRGSLTGTVDASGSKTFTLSNQQWQRDRRTPHDR